MEGKSSPTSTPFIFRSPFRPDQRAKAVKQNVASIKRDLAFIETHGYDEFVKANTNNDREDNSNRDENFIEENLGSTFEGTLRGERNAVCGNICFDIMLEIFFGGLSCSFLTLFYSN